MLQLKNVSAGYTHDVISDISFTQKEKSLCIIGPNGCGKSTLLKVIAGLIDYRGKIILDGIDLKTLKRQERAKKVAILSQNSTTHYPFSVFETVMMGRYAHMRSFLSSPSKSDMEYVEHCLSITNCNDVRNKRITELSGGQLQRVFLARALAQEPDLILLDEPTNHLDMTHQITLIDYLAEHTEKNNQSNFKVICVMHDLNLALRLTNNILLLNNGYIGGFGKSQDVMKEPVNRAYGLDVTAFMKESYSAWNELA